MKKIMPNRPTRHNAYKAVEVQREVQRNSNKAKIYDNDWRKFRNAYIKAHPLCAHCLAQGLVVAAREVDHIIPLTGRNDQTRLSASAVQSLCRECHSKKTAKETHVKRGL